MYEDLELKLLRLQSLVNQNDEKKRTKNFLKALNLFDRQLTGGISGQRHFKSSTIDWVDGKIC